jgi:hypothetical protein
MNEPFPRAIAARAVTIDRTARKNEHGEAAQSWPPVAMIS